jgi:outer membrane lipoprotein-sorting protein
MFRQAPTETKISPEAKISSEAKALLIDCLEKHRQLKSYSATVLVRSNDSNTIRSKTEIALQQPSLLRVSGTFDTKTQTALLDGENLYTTYSVEKAWYKAASVPLSEAIALADPTPLPILNWLLTEKDAIRKILNDGVVRLSLERDQTASGAVCSVFVFTMKSAKQSGESWMWFGKTDGLLRRVLFRVTRESIPISLLIDVTNVQLNPKLPPNRFVFSPPPGYVAKKTDGEEKKK